MKYYLFYYYGSQFEQSLCSGVEEFGIVSEVLGRIIDLKKEAYADMNLEVRVFKGCELRTVIGNDDEPAEVEDKV